MKRGRDVVRIVIGGAGGWNGGAERAGETGSETRDDDSAGPVAGEELAGGEEVLTAGTLVGGVEYVLSGRHETLDTVNHVMSVAQFAQYLLLVVALTWFYRQRRPTATMLSSG